MSNPEEKARELVEKMWQCISEYPSRSDAKQCALIAVGEILDTIPMLPDVTFWQSVKQEIEKL